MPDTLRYNNATVRSVSGSEPAAPAPAALVAMLQKFRWVGPPMGGDFLATTRSGRLMARSEDFYYEPKPTIKILDAPFKSGQPGVRSFTIHFPADISLLDGMEIAPNFVWLPDGKHLSFAYKRALWIIPVD